MDVLLSGIREMPAVRPSRIGSFSHAPWSSVSFPENMPRPNFHLAAYESPRAAVSGCQIKHKAGGARVSLVLSPLRGSWAETAVIDDAGI
jgi:hypothetical protein